MLKIGDNVRLRATSTTGRIVGIRNWASPVQCQVEWRKRFTAWHYEFELCVIPLETAEKEKQMAKFTVGDRVREIRGRNGRPVREGTVSRIAYGARPNRVTWDGISFDSDWMGVHEIELINQPATSPNSDKFWMVKDPDGGPASVKQATLEIASAEAARLAKANPGKKFVVLEAIELHYIPPATPTVVKL